MKYTEVSEKVAKELNIDLEVVNSAYKSMFEFIRETIIQLPLKTDLNEEEFNSLRTSFNIPSLGKLYCDYERYVNIKKRLNYIKKLQEDYENKQHKED